MLCRICKKEAVVALKSHNTAFCATCYLSFFRRQVERAIEKEHLLTHDDHILVALSGGKDSLALMLELAKQGYDVTGLHIDLGIPNASKTARSAVERFCARHALPLLIEDLSETDLAIPTVKNYLRRPICSACGSIKRYFFNKIAKDRGFTALATGHNLDDEVARLLSNTLRWEQSYLATQGPMLPAEGGFVRKVKPLWRLTEFETANYAFLCGIENTYAVCPYSSGASFSILKGLLQNLEAHMPGRKIDFYQGFLARGRTAFATTHAQADKLHPCQGCGYPTSAEEYCGVCRMRETIRQKKEERERKKEEEGERKESCERREEGG